jgi:enamine deaminase RidA (YjgF/YER057c/UK114 family)
MGERTTVTTGSTFEETFGYSRAVRDGTIVKVSATAAIQDGEAVAPGDAHEQARFILERIEETLEALDATMEDVIQTRVYVLDFDDWQDIGRAHREFFGEVKPANTMVEIAGLPLDGLRLEIEAEAVAEDPT